MRFGTINFSDPPVELPALVDFPSGGPLVLHARAARWLDALEAVRSLTLRILAASPPGLVRCRFVDPVGAGAAFEAFMRLADFDNQLVGPVATEPRTIDELLGRLAENVQGVIGTCLRGQYQDLTAYNAAQLVPEPYYLLAVVGFPDGFTEVSARRLESILRNGPRCGVWPVVLVDDDREPPRNVSVEALHEHAVIVAEVDGRPRWQRHDVSSLDLDLRLDRMPTAERVAGIVEAIAYASKAAQRRELPFNRIRPQRDAIWAGDSRDGVATPVGLARDGGPQVIELNGETSVHLVVAGMTGAGKTNLLHVLLTNLALRYSPEELELYLVDMKTVSFAPYAQFRLPHAKVVAIGSDREFGLSVLRRLDEIVEERSQLLRGVAPNSSWYRQRTGECLPRIVVVIDEFQELLRYEDKVGQEAKRLLDKLIRLLRDFGGHIVLASQSLHGASPLARSTIDQIGVRVALRCSAAESNTVLGEGNPAAAGLTNAGQAVLNAAGGDMAANREFQTAFLGPDEHEQILSEIRLAADERGFPDRSPVVFDGMQPARLEDNPRLQRSPSDAPAAPVYPLRIWLGEPVAIADPVAAMIRRASGSNLIMLGDERAGIALVCSALVSLVAQLSTQETSAPVVLLACADEDLPEAEALSRIAHELQVPLRGPRDAAEVIDELDTELLRRLDDERRLPPFVLVAHGLDRARTLRLPHGQRLGTYGPPRRPDEPVPPSEKLSRILRDGPDVGLHLIAWIDSVGNMQRVLDRTAIGEIGLRVALHMPDDDSLAWIDTRDASSLGPKRALLWDDSLAKLTKFRPYELPTDERLNELLPRVGRPGLR